MALVEGYYFDENTQAGTELRNCLFISKFLVSSSHDIFAGCPSLSSGGGFLGKSIRSFASISASLSSLIAIFLPPFLARIFFCLLFPFLF